MLQPNHLLQSFTIGTKQLKNRLVAAPIVTGFEWEERSKNLLEFWRQIAHDGVGMLIVPAGLVTRNGRPIKKAVPFRAEQAQWHQHLTEDVKKVGCCPILQLIHAGADAASLLPVRAQNHLFPVSVGREHRFKSWRLARIVKGYEQTAQMALQAGYEGVEIHASGRSLIASFLAQTQEEGEQKEQINQLSRFRLALEVVRAVRRQIGEDKIIGFRLTLMQLSPRGSSWEETLRFVQMLRIAGVDYLAADFGGYQLRIPTASDDIPAGVWNPSYTALAKNTTLPVIFGHNFGSLTDADNIAGELGNALFEIQDEYLADRQFLYKSLGLTKGNILPWIEQYQCGKAYDQQRSEPIFSLTQPEAFARFSRHSSQIVHYRKIAVIGAGMAGVHFALAAAHRGHSVTLFEEQDGIGGILQYLPRIKQTEKIQRWLQILNDRLELSTVNVKLATKVTSSTSFEENEFNTVVIATGTEAVMPDIVGIDSSNVVTFDEMFINHLPVGNRVAVLGVNRVSLAVCRYLLKRSKEENLTAEQWRNAWGVGDIRQHKGGVLGFVPEITPPPRRIYLLETERGQIDAVTSDPTLRWDWKWLLMNGVQTFKNCNIESIDNFSVHVSTGSKHTDSFTARIDHVLVCGKVIPNDDLFLHFRNRGYETYRVGSVNQMQSLGSLKTVIEEALELAYTL